MLNIKFFVVVVSILAVGLVTGQIITTNDYFRSLDANIDVPCGYNAPEGYPKVCWSEFTYTAADPKKDTKIVFDFYNGRATEKDQGGRDKEKNESLIVSYDLYSAEESCSEISPTTVDCSIRWVKQDNDNTKVKSGETVKFRIEGSKDFNTEVDWVPCTDDSGGLLCDKNMALWLKGPTLGATGTPPIAYYALDETSGTSAADSSGNGYNALYLGSPTFGVSGVYGKSFSPNGVAATRVSTPPTLLDTITDGYSISMWFNYVGNPVSTTNYYLVNKYLSNDNGRGIYTIYRPDIQRIVFTTFVNGTTTPVVDARYYGISVSGWHHAVFVYNGSTTVSGSNAIYIDGILRNSSVGSDRILRWPVDINVTIGTDYNGNAPFNGSIDDVQIYNRVLSAADILNLYESGITQLNITSPVNNSVILTTNVSNQINISTVIGVGDRLINATIIINNTQIDVIDYSSFLGYWNFDNLTSFSESNSFIRDVSNYASANGSFAVNGTTSTSGIYNGALKTIGFRGGALVNSSLIRPTTSMAFGGWINVVTDSGGQGNLIFQGTNQGGVQGYGLQYGDSIKSMNCYIQNASGLLVTSYWTATGINPPTNTWQHYVCNYDQTTKNLSIWINGVVKNWSIASGAINYINPSQGTMIGYGIYENPARTNHCEDCLFDDIFISNKSLSSGEIVALYRSNLARLNQTHYNLEEKNLTFELNIHNITVSACGGTGLVTCANQTVFFSIDTSTCQAPIEGSNWNLDCGENCTYTNTNYNVGNITFNGLGAIRFEGSNITGQSFWMGSSCSVWMNPTASIWVRK